MIDCATCPSRCPDIMKGNVDIFRFYRKISNCTVMASTMEGIYITGFRWTDIKTLADLYHFKLSRPVMTKLRKLEDLVIEESFARGDS